MALAVKNLPANAGDTRDMGLIPGLGWSVEGGHGNPLQYFGLKNPMDREAWQVTVHGVTESGTQLRWLSMYTYILIHKSLCYVNTYFMSYMSNIYYMFCLFRIYISLFCLHLCWFLCPGFLSLFFFFHLADSASKKQIRIISSRNASLPTSIPIPGLLLFTVS